MFRTSIIPIRLTVVGASFAISFAAMAAPLGAVPVTQTAADEVALYAAADPATGVLAVSVGTLTEAEIQDILFMREEEKLARDVYMTLGELWDAAIFTNIAGAESMHMTSVETLITRYGLDDPVDDNPVGVFVDPSLQSMYDDLVATGSLSLTDALEVGALVEEVDINDLLDSIAETSAADVLRVWQQLLNGSQNHLWAFTSQLAARGIDYEPAVLDVTTYDEMLSEAGRDTGGQGGDARGRSQGGRGHGRNS
jgi:hypothetical protein